MNSLDIKFIDQVYASFEAGFKPSDATPILKAEMTNKVLVKGSQEDADAIAQAILNENPPLAPLRHLFCTQSEYLLNQIFARAFKHQPIDVSKHVSINDKDLKILRSKITKCGLLKKIFTIANSNFTYVAISLITIYGSYTLWKKSFNLITQILPLSNIFFYLGVISTVPATWYDIAPISIVTITSFTRNMCNESRAEPLSYMHNLAQKNWKRVISKN